MGRIDRATPGGAVCPSVAMSRMSTDGDSALQDRFSCRSRAAKRYPKDPASAPVSWQLLREGRLHVSFGAAIQRLSLPARPLGAGLSHPTGMEIANFFAYPLGIMRRRSYDGGLSFSAKMQIDAEGGV